MKTLFLVLFVLSFSASVNAQIGAKTQQNKLTGIWQNNAFGYQMTLMLNGDGTGEFDGEAITYKAQENNLTITQAGMSNTYSFMLQGTNLQLSGGDLDASITFAKNGGTSEPANQPTQVSSSTKANGGSILGAWSNYGETIEFNANGQCTYLGQNYPYQVSGNQVILQTGQGDLVIAYTVQGNTLTLSINGRSLTYNKGKSAQQNQSSTAGSGKVDQSLAGKWCYVNVTSTNSGGVSRSECITLSENGTYQYYYEGSMSANTDTFSSGTASQNSDSGTWWVEGGRIYYKSQTQGQGSYQLVKQNHPKNGDPMIVLDGKTYVTYYQKSPW